VVFCRLRETLASTPLKHANPAVRRLALCLGAHQRTRVESERGRVEP
jgi:hypothetical protein